jgi:hypothetical protein
VPSVSVPFDPLGYPGVLRPTPMSRSLATTGSCATLIVTGRATPSWIVSHDLRLDQAVEGYQHVDNRDDGWTKVLLHPDRAA